MHCRVSFVIPALNEANYVANAVDAIHDAMAACEETPGYEVIVVDDGSSDQTAAIARRHRAHVIEVRKRNIAAVRNAGAKQAQGPCLVFVDADTQVSRQLVGEALQVIDQGSAWGTALASTFDHCPLWARLGLAAFNFYYVRLRKFAYGFFFFVRQDVFWQAGGFPEETTEGEDMALSKRLLKRCGNPTVLQTRVTTSARKTTQFGFWYHLSMLWLSFRYGDDVYTRPEIADYRDGELRAPPPQQAVDAEDQ